MAMVMVMVVIAATMGVIGTKGAIGAKGRPFVAGTSGEKQELKLMGLDTQK